jgi:fluoroacetyl-CoA thioesterase
MRRPLDDARPQRQGGAAEARQPVTLGARGVGNRCDNAELGEFSTSGGTMKSTLLAGITHELRYRVPLEKTVPCLYSEAPEFQEMPSVFATGYLVGLIEWACIEAVNPHLDWPAEQTVGVHVNVSHSAATPPGFVVTAKVHLVRIEGRRLFFEVEAHDGVDVIAKGTHERFVVDRAKFDTRVREKTSR